jgi:hypothetical protein
MSRKEGASPDAPRSSKEDNMNDAVIPPNWSSEATAGYTTTVTTG